MEISVFLGLGFIIILGVVLLFLLKRSVKVSSIPTGEYFRKPILTKSEQRFYYALNAALKHRYYIFAQVRLADIVDPRVRSWNTIRPITSKSVDFVLCDPETFTPIVVVELDDATHRFEDRKRRDIFVNATLRGAGIKVIRQPVQKEYNIALLTEAIKA
jgi:very-short-patch-repair endonuclease